MKGGCRLERGWAWRLQQGRPEARDLGAGCAARRCSQVHCASPLVHPRRIVIASSSIVASSSQPRRVVASSSPPRRRRRPSRAPRCLPSAAEHAGPHECAYPTHHGGAMGPGLKSRSCLTASGTGGRVSQALELRRASPYPSPPLASAR